MVELRDITKQYYEECFNLNIADSQKKFVSSTVHSSALYSASFSSVPTAAFP